MDFNSTSFDWFSLENYKYLEDLSNEELIKKITDYTLLIGYLDHENSRNDPYLLEMLSGFLSNHTKDKSINNNAFIGSMKRDFFKVTQTTSDLALNCKLGSNLTLLDFELIDHYHAKYQELFSSSGVEGYIDEKAQMIMKDACDFVAFYKDTEGENNHFYRLASELSVNIEEAKRRVISNANIIKLIQLSNIHSDSATQWFDLKNPIIQIDIKNNSDENLVEQFRSFLVSYRKEVNQPEPDITKPRRGDLEKVITYRAIAVIDLWIYQYLQNKKITQEVICEMVFPYEEKTIDDYKKRVIPLIKKVFNFSYIANYD